MSLLSEHQNPAELGDRLRDADAVTAEFMSDIISQTCRRFPSLGQSGKTARVERLIQSGAWTDAALALIDLELPQWQVRRIAYDEGEWHCALSRAARTSRLARSIDRGPSRRSGAGDPERIRRGPAHLRAGEPDQRSHRDARHRPASTSRCSATISPEDVKPEPGAAPGKDSETAGSIQVLVRFGLRLVILVTFAASAASASARSLVALLWMSTLLSAVVAA